MSPVFRSLNEVVTKVATFFILWFFVVFDGRVKPRVKPEFSHERLYFSGLLQIKNTLFKPRLIAIQVLKSNGPDREKKIDGSYPFANFENRPVSLSVVKLLLSAQIYYFCFTKLRFRETRCKSKVCRKRMTT